MTTLLPFQALVASAERPGDVVAPQYDSLAHGGRYQYALDHPDCFLNVVLSRGDFPDPAPEEHSLARRAADHFAGMLERDLFESRDRAAFYLYELSTPDHHQRGLLAGVPLEAIEQGEILGHEGVIPDRAADLAEFYRVARLSSSPVALGYESTDAHRAVLDRMAAAMPIRDFTGWDGVRQRLWAIDRPEDIAEVASAMADIGPLYVTDGHHRVSAVQEPDASPGWFLAALFPASELRVLEYNRCVTLARAPDAGELGERLGAEWEMTELGRSGDLDAGPEHEGDIHLLLHGVWHRIRFVGERPGDPVARLDVCLLHDRLLPSIFGVESDQDPRLAFVVGDDSIARLEEVVRSQPETVGFALHPTSVESLFRVADAGRTMPAKSTYFAPKPRSGLVAVRW